MHAVCVPKLIETADLIAKDVGLSGPPGSATLVSQSRNTRPGS
jgi:hypothetical protein